jgi:hypothetical protein
MYPQVTVDMALRLSVIGVLDSENARICGVSLAAIRHWRCGRRRGPRHAQHGPAAERSASCPRCHRRVMDESAYAYLLGLYLGDGHITRGRRNVFVLSLFCSDDWPGLLAAARSTMSDVMPSSGVFSVQRLGCTEVKSASKHWPCLFPQHGPGRKHTPGNHPKAMAIRDRREIPRRLRQRIVPFRWLARRQPGTTKTPRW